MLIKHSNLDFKNHGGPNKLMLLNMQQIEDVSLELFPELGDVIPGSLISQSDKFIEQNYMFNKDFTHLF